MIEARKLSKAQEEFLLKIDAMTEGEFVSLGGIDYNVLEKAANDGKTWAQDVIDGAEFPKVYVKTYDGYYEEALYCCYNPRLSRDDMIELIRNADILGPKYKTEDEIKQYFKDYLED